MIKYTKLWDGIKNSIEKANNKLVEYGKDFVKIKLNSDDNLPLNKTIKFHNVTIIRSVFEDNGKYYPQVFLDECLYELQMLEYDKNRYFRRNWCQQNKCIKRVWYLSLLVL